jgi:hypothetical protein
MTLSEPGAEDREEWLSQKSAAVLLHSAVRLTFILRGFDSLDCAGQAALWSAASCHDLYY